MNQRAVFLLNARSAQCPANLTPEGLKCRNCGRCAVGENTAWLEGLGYRVFIVPGSTFIKRMVKKYHPQAIIGVGCLTEVKDGIDMCDKIGITPMGVVNLKDGCVETIADWAAVRDVALLGLERVSGPVDLHGPSE